MMYIYIYIAYRPSSLDVPVSYCLGHIVGAFVLTIQRSFMDWFPGPWKLWALPSSARFG